MSRVSLPSINFTFCLGSFWYTSFQWCTRIWLSYMCPSIFTDKVNCIKRILEEQYFGTENQFIVSGHSLLQPSTLINPRHPYHSSIRDSLVVRTVLTPYCFFLVFSLILTLNVLYASLFFVPGQVKRKKTLSQSENNRSGLTSPH